MIPRPKDVYSNRKSEYVRCVAYVPGQIRSRGLEPFMITLYLLKRFRQYLTRILLTSGNLLTSSPTPWTDNDVSLCVMYLHYISFHSTAGNETCCVPNFKSNIHSTTWWTTLKNCVTSEIKTLNVSSPEICHTLILLHIIYYFSSCTTCSQHISHGFAQFSCGVGSYTM